MVLWLHVITRLCKIFVFEKIGVRIVVIVESSYTVRKNLVEKIIWLNFFLVIFSLINIIILWVMIERVFVFRIGLASCELPVCWVFILLKNWIIFKAVCRFFFYH